MAGNRQIVDPPRFTPLPFNLDSVVDWVSTTDPHWQNGITYQPTCTSSGQSTYDECIAITGSGATAAPTPWSALTSVSPRGATPFTIVAEFDCSAVGNNAATEDALEALARTESVQMESSFWTGSAGGATVAFPHLAANAQLLDNQITGGTVQNEILLQTSATVITGAGDSMNAPTALGLLESALGSCYGGVGVIHIPAIALPSFDAYGLIRQRGQVLTTLRGNKVAVGTGYPGTSPAGVARASNSCWIYGTGNIFGYKSEPRIRADGPQAFDKAKNTIKMISERTVLLGWDCCHFALNMSLGAPKGT